MILVDTSVLINFFKGIRNEKVDRLDAVIKNKIPFGINNLIYMELLQGARTEKEYAILKDYLSNQRFYNLKNGIDSYETASMNFFLCRRKGITVRSSIDLLIAQTAIENNLFLLHDDSDFSNMAQLIIDLKEY